MFLYQSKKQIKTTRLTVDLISYSGLPQEGRLSPYHGLLDETTRQLSRRVWSASIDHLIKYLSETNRPDYNADDQKPIKGKKYCKRTKEERAADTDYARRLEDIDESWVHSYVIDAIIGFNIDSNGFTTDLSTCGEATIFPDSEGNLLTSAYLESTSNDDIVDEIELACDKLPYLIKQVYYISIKYGISMFSMYGAYLANIELGNIPPKPRHILSYPIYRVDSAGNTTTLVPPATGNKEPVFQRAMEFILGRNGDTESYAILQEFGSVLKTLNITLSYEDPTVYNKEYMDNLVVTYVEKNKKFLWKGKYYDQKVMDSLGAMSVSDWNTAVSTGLMDNQDTSSFVSRLTSTMSISTEMMPINDLRELIGRYAFTDPGCKLTPVQYHALTNTFIDVDYDLNATLECFSQYEGFLALDSTSPYRFKLGNLFSNITGDWLINVNGFAVLVSNTKYTKRINLYRALEVLRANNGRVPECPNVEGLTL